MLPNRFLSGVLMVCIGMTLVLPVHAQEDISTTACQESLDILISREQRLWRSVLYGLTPPEAAQLSEVRYAIDGSVWLKTEPDTWRSAAEAQTPLNDLQMESIMDVPSRRGIFEQKRSLTSDLIPSITIAARAFGCRLEVICDALLQSESAIGTDPLPITTETEGCLPIGAQTIPACHVTEGEGNRFDQAQVRSYCNKLTEQVLLREFDLLRLAVEYDAAYRSLLQFAGNMDMFLEAYRGTLLGSLRSAASLVSWLGRIPCFIASCDDSPPSP